MAELASFYAASSAKNGALVWHKDIKDEAWASVEDFAGLKDALAAQAPAAAAGGGGAGGGGDESLSELKSRNGTLVRQLAEKVAEVQTLREQFAELVADENKQRRRGAEQQLKAQADAQAEEQAANQAQLASLQEANQSLRAELELARRNPPNGDCGRADTRVHPKQRYATAGDVGGAEAKVADSKGEGDAGLSDEPGEATVEVHVKQPVRRHMY